MHNIIIKIMAKPYKIYPAHIRTELWEKVEKELEDIPHLGDRQNSWNQIINKALDQYFKV